MNPIQEVLAQYGPEYSALDWRPVAGGFSDALLFAGSAPTESQPRVALKRWPPGTQFLQILGNHIVQKRYRAQLECIPELIANRAGRTHSETGEHYWDLSTWRPGVPATHLSAAEREAAARIIAVLHRIGPRSVPYPTHDCLASRVQHVNASVAACSGLAFHSLPEPLAGLCLEVRSRLHAVPLPIPFSDDPRHASLIHGDLHAGHLLFTGDAVTGVIDFASTKTDHPAVDLARYFGDTAPDPRDLAHAVSEYRTAGGDPNVSFELVQFLIGVIRRGAAAHWLRRFAAGDIPNDRFPAATGRLTAVLERLRAMH